MSESPPPEQFVWPPSVARPLGSAGFRKAVRSTRYLRRAADPALFALLPVSLVEELDFVNRYGRGAGGPRWDLAALSYLFGMWADRYGEVGLIEYHDGTTAEVAADELIATKQRVAEAISARFYLQRVDPDSAQRDQTFRALYEAVRRAIDRLKEASHMGLPLLDARGPARADTSGKGRDLYGRRYSFTGTYLEEHLPASSSSSGIYCSSPFYYLLSSSEPWTEPFPSGDLHVHKWLDEGTGLVDVAAAYEGLIMEQEKLFEQFDVAATKLGGYDVRERESRFMPWQRDKKKEPHQPCHVSVGVFRRGEATGEGRRESPCRVPYAIFEIDASDASASHIYARNLVGRLEEFGADSKDLLISYSGNRSFHVRLPSGTFGPRIFHSARIAHRVMARFIRRVAEGIGGPEGPLEEVLDLQLASPLHFIRAIGSEHEGTGDRTGAGKRTCVGFTGDEFRRLDLTTIKQYSDNYSAVTLRGPVRAKPSGRLTEHLEASVREVAEAASVTEGERQGGDAAASRGVIERILEGVRPGESFAPGYAGRNTAAFLLALYYTTNRGYDLDQVRDAVAKWNDEKNPVPLGSLPDDDEDEIDQVCRSARRAATREPL